MITSTADRTVLFADLRGSTGLFETLGNAEAAGVITRCVSAIATPVGAQGGRVVKTLGDGLMALFDAPSQAVRAAAKMQESLDAATRRAARRASPAPDLHLQVAIARGEVVEAQGDAYGDAINVAARLLDHAGDHEVLVTDEVVSGLTRSERTRFRSLDRLVLRGRIEPVLVHVAGGRRGADMAATQFGDVSQPADDPDGVRLCWADQSQTFANAQLPVVLGRSPQAAFCVDDSRVSRSHCRLDWHGGGFQLHDLSFNGTYVRFADGEVVSLRRGSCALHGHGVISLGGLPSDPTSATVSFEVVHGAGRHRDERNRWLSTR